MSIVELIALLFLVSVGLSALAERVGIAYPVLLVIGGLALGFVPGLPKVALPPDAVLLFALPPLLYWEAITAPAEDFGRSWRFILSTSVGLVLLTTVAVAVVSHALIGLPWNVAFLLGAVLGPTDELAVTQVAERFRVPRKLISAIEGEALFNDATSLVFYSVAVAAIVSGAFAPGKAAAQLAYSAVGSVIIGYATAWLLRIVWQTVQSTRLQTALSIAAPFIAYLPAQRFGVSGVLAVVTAGLVVNRYTPFILTPQTRQRALGFWETFVFAVNATLFMLVGLQLRLVIDALHGTPWYVLLGWAGATIATLLVTRAVWLFAHAAVTQILRGKPLKEGRWQVSALTSFAGIRGAVSLAAALAIPATAAGHAFPHRSLLIFLAYAVVIFTLVVQSLSLPIVIRALRIKDDGMDSQEQRQALKAAAEAALKRLEELKSDAGIDKSVLEEIEHRMDAKLKRYAAGDIEASDSVESFAQAESMRHIEREIVIAERKVVVNMRLRGEIDNVVSQRLTRMYDNQDLWLDAIEQSDAAVKEAG